MPTGRDEGPQGGENSWGAQGNRRTGGAKVSGHGKRRTTKRERSCLQWRNSLTKGEGPFRLREGRTRRHQEVAERRISMGVKGNANKR